MWILPLNTKECVVYLKAVCAHSVLGIIHSVHVPWQNKADGKVMPISIPSINPSLCRGIITSKR